MTQQRPRLDQVNLVVRDMDVSVEFYRRLGVDIPAGEPPWNAHHRSAVMGGGIDFDLDSDDFARQWDRGWPGVGGGVSGVLGFKLAARDDVDRVYADLTGAGYRGQQPPYDAFWGARYAIVEDPDGNPVGLMSPIDPKRRDTPAPPGE